MDRGKSGWVYPSKTSDEQILICVHMVLVLEASGSLLALLEYSDGDWSSVNSVSL